LPPFRRVAIYLVWRLNVRLDIVRVDDLNTFRSKSKKTLSSPASISLWFSFANRILNPKSLNGEIALLF
jgi:hypothetical protein